jgi:hypothetical protein
VTRRKPTTDGKPPIVVVDEDRFSTHFHGSRPLILAAISRAGCPAHWNPRIAAYSVPKAHADRVCIAIETGSPPGRIADRGLW